MERKKRSHHCAALNCGNNKATERHLSFFTFPKDPERSRKWVINICRADLFNKTTEELRRSYTLCSNHFEDSMFMNYEKRKLVWNAVPTLFDMQPSPEQIPVSRKVVKRKIPGGLILPHKKRPNIGNALQFPPEQMAENLLKGTETNIETPSRSSQGSWCSAPYCRNSRRKCPSLSFFSFPKEGNRCRQWVLNVGRADLLEKSPEYLYRNCCLCANHFEEDQFMCAQSKSRLIWNAVPTIFKRESLSEQFSQKQKPCEENVLNMMNPIVVLEDCMLYPSTSPVKRKKLKEVGPEKELPAKHFKSDFQGPVKTRRDACAVLSCRNNRATTPNLTFFPFPRDSERCKQWAKNIGRSDLLNKSAEFLHKAMVLCAEHFDKDQFMNAAFRKRLIWDAVPTNQVHVSTPPRQRGRPPKSLSPLKTSSPISVRQISSVNPPLEIELIKIPVPAPEETPLPKVVSVRSLAAPRSNSTVQIKPNITITQPTKPKVSTSQSYQPVKSHVFAANQSISSQTFTNQVGRQYTPIVQTVKIPKPQFMPTPREQSLQLTPEVLLKGLSKYSREPCLSLLDILLQRSKAKCGWKKWARKIALIMYMHFPQEYIVVSKLFRLPPVSFLRKLQSRKIFLPGLNNQYLAAFHDTEFSEGLKDGRKFFEEKVCILVVRQIILTPHLSYDKQNGIVLGLEDFGIAGRSKYPATHALVLTVSGLLNNWQFPIGYFPISKNFTFPMYSTLLFESLHQVESLGLLTKLIIFSDHKRNHQFVDFLNVTVAKPYVQFRSRRLMVMLNPLGLLKRFRHKLKKSDLEMGSERASWKHIEEFYSIDSSQTIPLVPQLTAKHINSPTFAPLPTRYVTDLFQYKLAAGLSVYSSFGRLPVDAAKTADVIYLMHQLLDCFSGLKHKSTADRPLRCAICIGSPHLRFLSDFLLKIRNWFFIDCPGVDPALRGWHLTIAALMQLWFDTQKFSRHTFLKTKYFRTRTKVMQKKFRKEKDENHMTCSTVSRTLNDVIIHCCITSPKIQKRPKQNPHYFLRLVGKLRQTLHPVPYTFYQKKNEPKVSPLEPSKNPSFPPVNILSYVTGYIAFSLFKNHSCSICDTHWVQLLPTKVGCVELFAMWLRKITESPVLEAEKMLVPTELCVETVRKCERLFIRCFPKVIHMDQLMPRISRYMLQHLKREFKLMCGPMRKCFLQSFIEMRITQALDCMNKHFKTKKLKKRSKSVHVSVIKM